MRNFWDTFQKRKQSFTSAFSICRTVFYITFMNKLCDWSITIYEKSFNSILIENYLETIHQKYLQFLETKISKFQSGLSLPIINDIFIPRQNIYNPRKFQELSITSKNTVKFDAKTIRGPSYRTLIPYNVKSEPTL